MAPVVPAEGAGSVPRSDWDFWGVCVDEVTRNADPPEEISGRREAPKGYPDRRHDRRLPAHVGRSRARNPDRAGAGRDQRPLAFRLSDLRQGRDPAPGEPDPFRRRTAHPARGRQEPVERSVRGAEEGGTARRARPGARARRGERPGAGRHGLYRPDARPAWRRLTPHTHRLHDRNPGLQGPGFSFPDSPKPPTWWPIWRRV